MKFIELTRKEFDDFAENNEQTTFQQSSKWGQFKSGENWHAYFVGLKEKNDIIAATMLLSKEDKHFKKRFFYAPRGFLIDYKNLELLKEFTTEIISYIKEKNGILLKIDPNILYQERNKLGEIIEGGINNSFIEQNIREVGFHHVGDDFKQNMIQPRWLYQISLKQKTLDDLMHNMSSKTRQIIQRNENLGISIRELKKEEFNLFCDSMKQVTEKYNTINYRLPYYEDLQDAFKKDFKIMVAEINFKHSIECLNQLLEKLEKKKEEKIQNYPKIRIKENTFINKILEIEKKKEQIQEKINFLNKIQKEIGQEVLLLAGYLYITYGREVVALQGFTEEKWKNFNASYSIHFHMLKWALENNYDVYNFYEISGNFNKKDPMYGSYCFKKSFGGQVVELLGEFDYPVSQKEYLNVKNHFPNYYGVKIVYKNSKK